VQARAASRPRPPRAPPVSSLQVDAGPYARLFRAQRDPKQFPLKAALGR
jgi:hypothetical protein